MRRTIPARTTTVAAAALTALGLALTTAAPASASNPVLRIKNSGGTVIAKAWYDDLTDNLCVRSYRKGKNATVRIGPSGGGTFATASDAGFGKNTNCTGNLSIPEDRYYWMILSTEGHSSKDTNFYT